MQENFFNNPWYFTNIARQSVLEMDTVNKTIESFAKSYEQQLHQTIRVEAIQLLNNVNPK